MRIYTRHIFIGMFGYLLSFGGAFASCNPGEYMSCELDEQYGSECVCECTPCQSGQTSNGNGIVNYCTNPPTINSGCSASGGGGSYCVGYDDCPSGVGGTGKKCKLVSGCPSGCQKYEICNVSNGATGYEATGACHIEGLACYENQRNCANFGLVGSYSSTFAGGVFTQSDQRGTATWNNNTWNVSNCRLQRDNLDISDRNCRGSVWRTGAEIVGNATIGYTIKYNNGVEWYYCTHCDAGKTPQIVNSSDGFDLYACQRYENDSAYTACSCTGVEAGFFSTGCDITYPLNSATVPDACHMQGAVYKDSTGSFMLGPNACN